MRYSCLWSRDSFLCTVQYYVQSLYGAKFLWSLVLICTLETTNVSLRAVEKESKEPLAKHSFDQL